MCFFCFTGNCVAVKQKRLYVPPNARYACSAMDESKTVAALRRSRFLALQETALRPRSYHNHTFPNTNEYGSGFPISSAVMLSSIRIIFRKDAICSHMRSRLNFSI